MQEYDILDCEDICKREGLTVVGVFSDRVTATKPHSGRKSPGFSGLRALVDAGGADVVIVGPRLFALINFDEAVEFVRGWAERGVRIIWGRGATEDTDVILKLEKRVADPMLICAAGIGTGQHTAIARAALEAAGVDMS
jgi:hypothetical protein